MPRSVVRTWFLPLLAAAALGACGITEASPRVGTFDGEWDGDAWRGRAVAVLRDDTLWVTGHRPDPQYFYDEYVTARVPFRGPGAYTIRGDAGHLSRLTGGDAGSFTDAGGVLLVRSYDRAERVVTGTLTLRGADRDWRVSGEFSAGVYDRSQDVPPARGR